MKQLNKLRMKRFYLTLCFLMSIIGSAWGQETVTETFVVDAADGTDWKNDYVNANKPIVSTDGKLSITFEDGPNDGVQFDAQNTAFKFRQDDGYCVITPEDGVIIKSISLTGKSSKRDILYIFNGDTQQTVTSEGETDNWTNSFDNTNEVPGVIKFARSGNNALITNIEVTYTYTPITTYDKSFNISDFNYVTNRNANSGLDRSLCGFTFEFSGGDALKCNATDKLTFRTRNTTQNGSVAISTTNGAKIFSASFTFDKDMTDYYTAKDGDGNDLASSVSGNVVTVTSATGVSKIVFAKKNVAGDATDGGKEFALSAISLTTGKEMPTDMVTPELTSFKSSAITVDLDGGKVDNPLTTNPPSFAVTYSSSNTDVATVDTNTGAVTLHAAGETTITAEYGGGTYYNAAASTSYTLTVTATPATPCLEISSTEQTLNADYVYETNACSTNTEGNNGGNQIIDNAKDGAYILFDVKPTENGTYVFTAPIATNLNGMSVQLGYINEDGDYVVSSTTAEIPKAGWNKSNATDYEWKFYLEAGTRYTFKMSCLVTDDYKSETYRVNVFDMTIKKSENYLTGIWTITDVTNGKKLTINNGQSGLLASGSSATLEGFAKVTFAGQDWTVTTSDRLNGGCVSGRKTSGLTDGVPNGEYLEIQPVVDGVLTLDASHWRNATSYIRRTDGSVVNSFKFVADKTIGALDGEHRYEALLKANETYYVYIDNNSYDLNIEAITFTTPAEQTLNYSIADFNYFAGTSVHNGANKTGLDRKNVRGLDFTFTGDGMSPKFNNVGNGLNISSSNSTMTVSIAAGSDKLANSENKIVSVEFTKPDGNPSDGSLDANVDGNWNSGVFTPTTPAAKIAFTGDGSDFKIGNMKVTTLYEKNYSTITPVLTFEKEAVEAAVGATLTNPLTVKNGDVVIENFRVVYTVSDATIATIEEKYGTATITPLKAGEVTITATFDGKRWGDADQNNNIYSAASKTFTLTVIAETVSFEKNEVVFAVNTNKAYTAATGDDGKVTYTALEGNVNAATSSASNAITYTSSDENLIKVNAETGELSLGDNWTAGKTVTITATSAAGQTATYTVKLKFETSISFGDANGDGMTDNVETVYGHLNVGFVEPQATVVPAGVNIVTYTSNKPATATINASTGEVTFPSSSTGAVGITATIPDNDYYMGSSAQYQIFVGNAVTAGSEAMNDYQIQSYADATYTANNGHKFTVEPATAGKKIISGEQFTNVPGIEVTFGAYTGAGDVNDGDLANLGTVWTVSDDKYLVHNDTASYNKDTNLPTGGGYVAFEPVVSGILSLDLVWHEGETFVLVDKFTNEIVESYTASTATTGEHRFSEPLVANHTYYLYNRGGKVDGEKINSGMKFRSVSFTPVFVNKVTGLALSKITDGIVEFNIEGDDFFNGTSAIPSLSTAQHDHDDITYTVEGDNTYLGMTADGVFEVLEAMESNNNAVTVTIKASIEAKTAAPNDDTDGDSDKMHSSTATCKITYTKGAIRFSKNSISVNIYADNVGTNITEPVLNYQKDGVTYASSNTNAFTVDANTGVLAIGSNFSGETTITATVSKDDLLRYYTNNSASYVINAKNYSHVNITDGAQVELTVGQIGYNLLKNNIIQILGNDKTTLEKVYRLNANGSYYGDAGKRLVYYNAVVDQFINNNTQNNVNTFIKNASNPTTTNGSQNTNVVMVDKVLNLNAKSVGTTTVYVNFEKMAYSENGQDSDPTTGSTYDAVTIPVIVIVKPRTFTPEDATLRAWDFSKNIDATTLKDFANNNSSYWTYNEGDNNVKTKVVRPEETDDEAYYSDYIDNKEGFLADKNAFEEVEFSLSSLKEGTTNDILKLTTYNSSNYEKYVNGNSNEKNNHELNIVSDITINMKSTIKDNNYMPSVSGSNTNLDQSSEEYHRGLYLDGKASFMHVPNVTDNISVVMIADHNSKANDDYIQFASSVNSNQPGLFVGPMEFKDGTYADGYNYNRLTNVITYRTAYDKESNLITELAVEPQAGSINIISVIAGYPAAQGILNKGEGKEPTSADTRTDGYTTLVSPYNIDMTGQKAVKAYICDYYGKENNKVHMKQIRHIPANTPVMLRGYARDLYCLFISNGNADVDPGVDEYYIKNNRLRGNATEDIYVPLEEEDVTTDGSVHKYYNYGLSGSTWVKYGAAGWMKAGKAYLRLTEEEWADLHENMASASSTSATRLSFEFEDLEPEEDNTSTGIESVNTQNTVKGDGYYYNFNGMRIGKEKPTAKGVYIYNGKKFIIK